MADGVAFYSSADQIASNYEKYKDYFSTDANDTLDQSDFLTLMVEQMKNQDFTNPTDNTEFIAQLAQFSSLQQIQEMAYYTNASYAANLIGKTVVVAASSSDGSVSTVTDVVSSVKMNGTNFEIVVGGSTYSFSNIMEILAAATTEASEETDEAAAEKAAEEEEIVAPNYSQGC
jgi:flagellar hook assembly protein FlgD